jgi:hypothetical protein
MPHWDFCARLGRVAVGVDGDWWAERDENTRRIWRRAWKGQGEWCMKLITLERSPMVADAALFGAIVGAGGSGRSIDVSTVAGCDVDSAVGGSNGLNRGATTGSGGIMAGQPFFRASTAFSQALATSGDSSVGWRARHRGFDRF